MLLHAVVVFSFEVVVFPVCVCFVEEDDSRVQVLHVLETVREFGACCIVPCLEPVGVFLDESECCWGYGHWLMSPAFWPGVIFGCVRWGVMGRVVCVCLLWSCGNVWGEAVSSLCADVG